MKRIALFLGAGASKPFGCPLTNEILPLILQKVKTQTLFMEDRDECALLKNFLYKLMPGLIHGKEFPLITDILSLIDYLRLHSNPPWPARGDNELDKSRILLERAIVEILEPSFVETVAQLLLQKFSDWIVFQTKEASVSIISTNYDISIESKLFERLNSDKIVNNEIDFGFSWREVFNGEIQGQPREPFLSIYKLHGSINWLRCELCEHIYINTRGSIYHLAFKKELDDYNTCHCGNGPLRSVIIAPSIERNIRDVNLLSIWKNSLEILRKADEWIIVGYSLPLEDLTIRSMFLRAYHGRKEKPQITIVQKGDDFKNRYSLFFDKFEYWGDGMEAFIKKQTTPIF